MAALRHLCWLPCRLMPALALSCGAPANDAVDRPQRAGEAAAVWNAAAYAYYRRAVRCSVAVDTVGSADVDRLDRMPRPAAIARALVLGQAMGAVAASGRLAGVSAHQMQVDYADALNEPELERIRDRDDVEAIGRVCGDVGAMPSFYD